MIYEFSDCVLDIDAHTLTRSGEAQSIEPMVFDLLHLLVRNAGHLVSRDQMIEKIWQGRIVSESAVSARIAALRRAVGDDGKAQAVIKTIPRRGLQFVAKLSGELARHPIETTRQTIKFATADDGVNLAYAISGSGPPLLRVHHFPCHLELEWQEETERAMLNVLGASHTLIRFDQRGAGLSDIDVKNFGIPLSVEDIKAIADAAGLDEFSLFGMSGGALIATEFAAKYPERISKLVLLGGYVEGRSIRETGGAPKAPDAIESMFREGWDAPSSAFVKASIALYFPTASSEMLQEIAEQHRASCPAENAIRVREIFNNYSIANVLDKVSVPTLVMQSRNDAVHPLSQAKQLASGIKGAEFMVLESPNHYPLLFEPSWQVMMDAMMEFLARDT